MRKASQKLDDFLRFNDRDGLPNAGVVERRVADEHAETQYEAFAARRRAQREQEGADALAEIASNVERVKRAPGAKRGRKGDDEQ